MATNKFANASRKPKTAKPEPSVPATPVVAPPKKTAQSGARAGKKAISAYFSPELSRALGILAKEQDQTVQAMLGEALDDLMLKYKKVPFGER
ncbi:ribbon-helix-helix domain-containing protein [Qipengyuania citrea]|uniref:ribbon-helix-helix domain-containing protein n=1 Tax=Qipengyuania citrea TaxID=225971 RepID=UPI003298C3AA